MNTFSPINQQERILVSILKELQELNKNFKNNTKDFSVKENNVIIKEEKPNKKTTKKKNGGDK